MAEGDSLIPLVGWKVGNCHDPDSRTTTDSSGRWWIPIDSLVSQYLCYSHEDTLFLQELIEIDTTVRVRVVEPMRNPGIAVTFDSDPRDGEVYRLSEYDGDAWIAQNLRHKTSEAKRPLGVDSRLAYHVGLLYDGWETFQIPKACEGAICSKGTASSFSGVCPSGWHVPNADEWRILMASNIDPVHALAMPGGGPLKARIGWGITRERLLINPSCYDIVHRDPDACHYVDTSMDANGSDGYGFTAYPNFVSPSLAARWWVSDSGYTDSGLVATIGHLRLAPLVFQRQALDSLAGVRCVRN